MDNQQHLNLNYGFPKYSKAKDMYEQLLTLTERGGNFTVRNFVGVVETMHPVSEATVPTPLFPKGALDYYSLKNMGESVSEEQRKKFQVEERGGEQGDYSLGMQHKIRNVIECLQDCAHSKCAVLPIPFAEEGSQSVNFRDKGQTKCMRELHFYLEDGMLKCTGFLRMQHAVIFPKNIHFVAKLMEKIATALDVPVGEYTHFITNLCHDRRADHS